MKPLLVFSVIIQSLLTYLEQPWPILSPKTLLWSKQTFTQSCAHHMSLTESIFFTAFSLIFCLLRLNPAVSNHDIFIQTSFNSFDL